MPWLEHILPHVVPFVLVTCRLAGLMMFTPLLASRLVPRRFKALLSVMFALAVYPALSGRLEAPAADIASLAPLVAAELLLGALIGFMAGLPILALDLAGYIMGHQMGIGLARVYNPEMDADTEVLGQLLMLMAIAGFLAMGGLDSAFLAVVHTFERVPLGGFAFGATPLDAIVGLVSAGFELAVRIAAPVTCVVFLLLITLGLLMKTMPQINVMSVGFSLKAMAGLGVLCVSICTIHDVMMQELARVGRLVLDWAGAG